MALPSDEHTADLDAWILATAPRALAYAQSLLKNEHQAEDIVQDCYCRLLQKADQYDLPKDGLKILLRAITNASINLKTRRKPMRPLSGGTDDDGPIELPDGKADQPFQIAIGHELQQALQEALQQLPQLQRAAIELKSLGYSQQEISEILDVAPNHVGVLIHRARHTLAGLLAPKME